MARVRIGMEFSDGDRLSVEVSVSEFYPDVLDQARANAKALWADALGLTLEATAGEDDGG